MGKSANHVYSIDLDINTPASSKQALKELQTAYSNSNNSMNELNKTYAFDTVEFSEWLTELRKAILEDTLEKIEQ